MDLNFHVRVMGGLSLALRSKQVQCSLSKVLDGCLFISEGDKSLQRPLAWLVLCLEEEGESSCLWNVSKNSK